MIGAFIVLSILSIWFLASVLCQLWPPLRRRLYWWSFFLRLPRWTLFNRPVSNYHLLYRDRLVDGSVSAWQMVRFDVPRVWYNVLWNPQFWLMATVWQMVRQLKLLVQAEQPPTVPSTIPYRTIQRYVAGLPRSSDSTARQFMIMDGIGHVLPSPPRVLFTSEFHAW